MTFDKEELRVRFWALKKAVDAAKAKIEPLRAKRDAYVNKYSDREGDEDRMAPIRAIQSDVLEGVSMFDAEQEMAGISRFLGGTVGEDPNL